MGITSYVKRTLRWIIRGIPEQHTTVVVREGPARDVLKGRRVLITGGGRGLGFSIAERCVREGAQVLISGRNEATLKKAVSLLGGDAHAKCLVLDVQDVSCFADFLSKAETLMGGKIDSLVCNAGISLHEGDFRNVTENGWDRQFDTNLKGSYFLVQQFVLYLERHEDVTGNIVVMTSERAKRSDDIPYGLTKIATSSFIQGIASKIIAEGIRLNGVGPGVTASDMTGIKKDGNLFAGHQAGKRFFVPEEVAEVVNFLLSDASASISGEVITCDQGAYIVHW